jgi:hypothetical protein
MKRSGFLVCAATAALAAAVLGVSACSAGTTSMHAAMVAPGATARESVNGVPLYQPSTTRTRTASSATLTSPDSVTKVSDYYVGVVHKDGWTTVSKSMTAYHGHLTIKKSGLGATISVAPSGSGSLITISTYPTS